jgi:uncharacterized protein (DUF2126 family)/transglutaminase-like putative cysteine protease
MSIHAALAHRTRYTYDRAVTHGPHIVRLRPAPHCKTRIVGYSLKVEGGTVFTNWQQDPFSNWNARLVFPDPLRELVIDVELIVEMAVLNPFDFFLEDSAQKVPFEYDVLLARDLAPFVATSAAGGRFETYFKFWKKTMLAEKSPSSGTLDFLVALNQALQRDVSYLIRLEPGVQSPEETLEKGSGSCRDSAWLMCALLRRLGFAARFVSGYLIQLKPDVKAVDGPSGAAEDFTDLHAWCEVYLPGAGWVGFDPTSGLLAGEGHIPLSCTPEPSSSAPVTGMVGPCRSQLEHRMSVARVYESPRVTKPYSEEEWSRILALGHDVDAALKADDVRLTMGGEPTFVSTENPDGPEWNFTAVSQSKRVLSGQLIRRLRERFAPGALLHYGQGKWYPGEVLPRYALSAFWRRDGVPVWKNPEWIADEARDYGHGLKEAKQLIEEISRLLRLDRSHILAGHEDALYYHWKESRLPSNVRAEEPKAGTPQEKERLRRLYSGGLENETGYVLPLRNIQGAWQSSRWFLRHDGGLWLIPGDSPMGLRLPLDSLPWVSEADFPHQPPPDPTQPLPPLRGAFAFPVAAPSARARISGAGSGRTPAEGESAPWVVRTALCVEPRNGRLHVFLPPLQDVEAFLELIAAVEHAAAAQETPVVLEGDPPPADPRINKLGVTPDPGVIEVNLHPSATWGELVERTETLYEEARLLRLGTEKFMLDGRHTGTGGGNHVIIGGATPLDSPVLRRPDLLRSMLSYWQNHPSLSWLFSGLFIGPTSQAPRVDESRHDSLYELEIAFQQVPPPGAEAAGEAPPPWLVDRLFRNLLMDASGNTHRTEFSIDKLYSPDGPTGRLGLLELRAFEMPPHARMSLVQQLLLRSLVSMFWRKPYTNGFVRWGADLHDRWMLPHFCRTDMLEVVRDLNEAGFPFHADWLAPHFEFRFPKVGEIEVRDIRMELRFALEPWHVLGEEGSGGGTVRYVDSSLERLQVKVSGISGDRFVLACNGRRVPLHATGTNGEAVAGVRYRAWQPPGCLHPNLPPDAPLVFDIYDTWNKRSLGGCTYHVAHPGGRNYETFPVNAYEAESRRLARFFAHGHTQGKSVVPPGEVAPDCPFTLDLRRSRKG